MIDFESADVARAASFGGFLAVAYGCHVPSLTHEQAQAALHDARHPSGVGGKLGHCRRCGRGNVMIMVGRTICRDCYNLSQLRAMRAKRASA